MRDKLLTTCLALYLPMKTFAPESAVPYQVCYCQEQTIPLAYWNWSKQGSPVWTSPVWMKQAGHARGKRGAEEKEFSFFFSATHLSASVEPYLDEIGDPDPCVYSLLPLKVAWSFQNNLRYQEVKKYSTQAVHFGIWSKSGITHKSYKRKPEVPL